MCANEKLVKNYIKQIKKNLICSDGQKKQVLKDIENSVRDYLQTNKNASEHEIYSHFGTPEDVVSAYMTEIDLKEIKRKVVFRKVIIFISVIVIAFILALGIDGFLETFPFKDPVIYISPAIEGTTEYITDEVLL